MEHPRNALHLYRRRWGIECLFSDAKTRGFNIVCKIPHVTDSGQTLDPPRHRHPRRDVGTPLRDPGDGVQANRPEVRTKGSRSPGSEPNSMLCGGGSSTTRMMNSRHGKRPSRKDRSNYPKSSESCTVQALTIGTRNSTPNIPVTIEVVANRPSEIETIGFRC